MKSAEKSHHYRTELVLKQETQELNSLKFPFQIRESIINIMVMRYEIS